MKISKEKKDLLFSTYKNIQAKSIKYKEEENEKMYEISNSKLNMMRITLSILEINIFI